MRFVIVMLAVCAFAQSGFVPADFAVPTLYRTEKFKLIPLGPDVVKQDYEAYMSSIETCGRPSREPATGRTKT